MSHDIPDNMSQDIGDTRPPACGHVEGTPGDHRSHLEKRPVAEVVATYGVSRSWLYELLARYREQGEAAFEPRSRRPHTSPGATQAKTVDLVLRLRKELLEAGHDAGPETISWHLIQHHDLTVSRATVHRILTRQPACVRHSPQRRGRNARYVAVRQVAE